MTGLAAIPLYVLIALGATATWTDITARRIPNWLSLITLAAALGYAGYSKGLWPVGSHALHAVIALAVGMALYAAGAIGGGDAKFYAAAAAWFPLGDAWRLFVLVSGWGVVVLIIWFTVRRARGKPIRRQREPGDGMPYGVAIAAGAITLASIGVGL